LAAATLSVLVGLIAVAPAAAVLVVAPHYLGTLGPGDLEIRVNGIRILLLSPTTDTVNVVGGAPSNMVGPGRIGGTIAGGGGTVGSLPNIVWGDHGSIGGGLRHRAGGTGGVHNFADATVRGGESNFAIATGATVGGGWLNVASGASSTIAGGSDNAASGLGSTVGGGSSNVASGAYSTVPGGVGALADHHGQLAFSAGAFADPGDAQASLFVLRRQTNDATSAELSLDGDSARLTIAPDRALVFRVLVAGRSTTGSSAAYTASGVIVNAGGATSMVASPTVTVLGEEVAAWSFKIEADNANDALVLEVTGAAATTIRWVATVETTEVAL
jgi:hypothetical protein